MSYLLITIGFILLLAGAEVMVRGCVALAERSGVSPLVIGLTVVAFGTSAPELVVSVNAALTGAPGIAIGNVVGSNIANILLILGIAGVIAPVASERGTIYLDTGKVLGATVIFIAFLALGEMVFWQGTVLLALLAAFLLHTHARAGTDRKAAAERLDELAEFEGLAGRPLWLVSLAVVGGLAAVLGGAEALVRGGVQLATRLGVGEEVIGLSLVAVGTSLPELATTIAASIRRQAAMALGNVLGSNLFNILGVIGVTATLTTVPVPVQIIRFDAWVMLAASLLVIPFAGMGGRLSRPEAALMLAAYGGYIAVLFLGAPDLVGWTGWF